MAAVNFVISDKPISDNPLSTWKILVESGIKGVYHSVPISSIKVEPEPQPTPNLEQVTGVANSTTRKIRLIESNQTGYLQLERNTIRNIGNDLNVRSDKKINFWTADAVGTYRNAMYINQNGSVVFPYRSITGPEKLAVFDVAGMVGERLPGDFILAGAGLQWEPDKLTLTAIGTGDTTGDWVPKTGGAFTGEVSFNSNIRIGSTSGEIRNSDNSTAQFIQATGQSFYANTVQAFDIFGTYSQFNNKLKLNNGLEINQNLTAKRMMVLDIDNKVKFETIPSGGGSGYTLPPATHTTLGGVIPKQTDFTLLSDGTLGLAKSFTDTYLSKVTFLNGVFSFERQGRTTLDAPVNLDNRYALKGEVGGTLTGTLYRIPYFDGSTQGVGDSPISYENNYLNQHNGHGYKLYTGTVYKGGIRWIQASGTTSNSYENDYLFLDAGRGIMTKKPGNVSGGNMWKLGGVASSGDLAVSRIFEVEVDGQIFQLYGRLKP